MTRDHNLIMTTHHQISDALNKYLDVCIDPVHSTAMEVYTPGGSSSAWTQKVKLMTEFTAGGGAISAGSNIIYGWCLINVNIDNTKTCFTYTTPQGNYVPSPPAIFAGRDGGAVVGIDGAQFLFPYSATDLNTTFGQSSNTKNSFRVVSCGVRAKYNTEAQVRGGSVWSYSSPINRDISGMSFQELISQNETVRYDLDETNEFVAVTHARLPHERDLKSFTLGQPWANSASTSFFGQQTAFNYYDYGSNTVNSAPTATAGLYWVVNGPTAGGTCQMECKAAIYCEYEGLRIGMLATQCHSDPMFPYVQSVLQHIDKIHATMPSSGKRHVKGEAVMAATATVTKKVADVLSHSGVPFSQEVSLGLGGIASFLGHEAQRRLRRKLQL